jgi:hypothetical protein
MFQTYTYYRYMNSQNEQTRPEQLQLQLSINFVSQLVVKQNISKRYVCLFILL